MFRRYIATTAATLAVALPAVAQQYYGFDHTPRGDAVLETDAQGRLKISNLGSSGKDGVSIDLGDANGFGLELDIGPAGGLAAGQCSYVYHPYDWRNGCIYVYESGGGSAALGIEGTGEQPSCVHVELLLGDQVVDSRTYELPLPTTLVSGNLGGGGGGGGGALSLGFRRSGWDYIYDVRNPGIQLLTLTNSPTGPVDADGVRITLDGLPPGEYYLGQCEVRAANTPSGELTVMGEAVLLPSDVQDDDVRDEPVSIIALGGAGLTGVSSIDICQVCPHCCDPPGGMGGDPGVSIMNLGSTGLDGVCTRLPPSTTHSRVTISSTSIDLPDPDDAIVLNARGTFSGLPDRDLGTLSLRRTTAAGPLELDADYAAVGAIDVIVEVRDQGVLVASVPVPTGTGTPVALITPSPAGLGWNKCGKLGTDPPCFFACTEFAFEIEVGGALYVGNDLRVLAAGATGTVDSLSAFDIRAAGVDPFTIAVGDLGEGSPPVIVQGLPGNATGNAELAVGDLDGDGRADLTVSNIGSSGEDGVRVDPGTAQGMDVHFAGGVDVGQAGKVFTGTIGVLDGEGHATCTVTVTGQDDTDSEMAFECGAPGTTVTIEVRDAFGNTLASTTTGASDTLTLSSAPGATRVIDGFRVEVQGLPPGEPVVRTVEIPPGGIVQVTHPGLGTVPDVGSIALLSDVPGGQRVTSMTVQAAGSPSFTIDRLAVVEHDNDHTAQGDVIMQAESCISDDEQAQLAFSVGSGGGTGGGGAGGTIRIDWRDTDSDDDGLPDIDQLGGASFVLDGTTSQDDAVVSTFTWTQVSGPFSIVDDDLSEVTFTLDPGGAARDVGIGPMPWMAPESIVARVLDGSGGMVTVSGTLSVGSVATVMTTKLPGTYEFELTVSDGSGVAGGVLSPDGAVHRMVWDSDVNIALAGQPAVVGRALEIVSSPGPGVVVEPVDLGAFELEYAVNGQVGYAISEESVKQLAPPCPADTDGDGMVSVTDLLAVILGWGPCPAGPCPADIDGDGSVSVTDLLAVILAWGACP